MENNEDIFKKDSSPEEDILLVLYENIAADLLNLYGPEGSYKISKILMSLVQDDFYEGMSL
jgi:hypothetical protein